MQCERSQLSCSFSRSALASRTPPARKPPLVQDCFGEAASTTRILPGAIQLAGAFQMSNAKLADKYLAGKAGGRYGIGGTESVIFKKKKK